MATNVERVAGSASMSDNPYKPPLEAPRKTANRRVEWTRRLAWGGLLLMAVVWAASDVRSNQRLTNDAISVLLAYGLLTAAALARGWGVTVPIALFSVIACQAMASPFTNVTKVAVALFSALVGGLAGQAIERWMKKASDE